MDKPVAMIRVYAELVKAGRKTIDQVPKHLKQDVEEELVTLGYATTTQE